MFTHVMLGSNDLERSRRFYDALAEAMGAKPGALDPKGRLIYVHGGGRLMLSKPIDGGTATAGNGSTLGFDMKTPEMADAWHKAGVENGGEAVEDPPGMRQGGGASYYLAYLRDPDGNKLCGLHRMTA